MPPRPTQPDGRVHGVIAAIHDDRDRWLMVRRSRHVAAPRKVCFPGGAVEPGETQEDAVVREIREELGLIIHPIRLIWRWDDPLKPLTLFGWLAEVQSGIPAPDPAEIEEILWMTCAEGCAHPDGLPTNPLFIACLPPI